MNTTTYLIGAEEATKAANKIRHAIDDLQQIEANQEQTLRAFQQFLDAWLVKLEELLILKEKNL